MWTFAENPTFPELFDLNHRLLSKDEPFADMLLPVPATRPNQDDHWLLFELRRSWDWLDPAWISDVIEATVASVLQGRAAPKARWLILGLTSVNEDLWDPPRTVSQLVQTVSSLCGSDPRFEMELTSWCSRNKSALNQAIQSIGRR